MVSPPFARATSTSVLMLSVYMLAQLLSSPFSDALVVVFYPYIFYLGHEGHIFLRQPLLWSLSSNMFQPIDKLWAHLFQPIDKPFYQLLN